MWMTTEDGQRYRELSGALQQILREHCPGEGEQPVSPEDLCIYLEWFELAREGAPSIRPFIDRSSPHMLRSLSYQQLAQDLKALMDQVHAAQGGASR